MIINCEVFHLHSIGTVSMLVLVEHLLEIHDDMGLSDEEKWFGDIRYIPDVTF